MKTRIVFASVATLLMLLATAASQDGGKKDKDNGRRAMPIYITPFYDSRGLNVAVGEKSKKLASADAKTILELSTALKREKDKLRAEVMYVTAIRLYDLGHKDDAVYWFYTAQFRARVFSGILDKEKVGTIGSEAFELNKAYASFNQLAGVFINGYAFGELPKLEKTLLKVVEESRSLPKFGDVYPKVKFVEQEKWEGVNREVSNGLTGLIAFIKTNAEMIKEQRKKNGIEGKF